MRLIIAVTLCGMLCGCELQPATSGAPVHTCERPADRCKLSDGKLGVCTADSQQRLFCASQH